MSQLITNVLSVAEREWAVKFQMVGTMPSAPKVIIVAFGFSGKEGVDRELYEVWHFRVSLYAECPMQQHCSSLKAYGTTLTSKG